MISTKLVQIIETHSEEITQRLVQAVRKHSDMQHLARRPEIELREWCQAILVNLGDLLSSKDLDEQRRRYRGLGQTRFEENIPLHEAVLRFHLLKDLIIEFIHEQGFPMNAMQLYAGEELELRLMRFFDAGVYNLVCGYENALRRAARIAS